MRHEMGPFSMGLARVLLGLCRGRTLLNRNRSNQSISDQPEVGGAKPVALRRSTHICFRVARASFTAGEERAQGTVYVQSLYVAA
jgi:hypothetical protein